MYSILIDFLCFACIICIFSQIKKIRDKQNKLVEGLKLAARNPSAARRKIREMFD